MIDVTHITVRVKLVQYIYKSLQQAGRTLSEDCFGQQHKTETDTTTKKSKKKKKMIASTFAPTTFIFIVS